GGTGYAFQNRTFTCKINAAFHSARSNGTVTAVKRPFEIAKNQSANLHREFTLLAISFAVAKLALLILAVCRATYAVELMRLIYQLLTIQLNRLTVFWVPLLPKPHFTAAGPSFSDCPGVFHALLHALLYHQAKTAKD
ncbi:hypothetical protein, partial [Salmonella enterica]|uniref:hypothetical protein n=1 Tax=Salmonella enterica TaxID=28901 RepID=UPI0021B1CEA8